MITEIINGKHYEQIASTSDGEFSFLKDEVASDIIEKLYNDASTSEEGYPKIMAKLRLARFLRDVMAYDGLAYVAYSDTLCCIMDAELKHEHPRYEEFAMECAYAPLHKHHEPDQGCINIVKDFYKSFYNRPK